MQVFGVGVGREVGTHVRGRSPRLDDEERGWIVEQLGDFIAFASGLVTGGEGTVGKQLPEL